MLVELNRGWVVAKRLLQHERSGLAQLANAGKAGVMERISPSVPLSELGRQYRGVRSLPGEVRHDLSAYAMRERALSLTQCRAVAESEANTPGYATSIFKYVEAEVVKRQLELQLALRGTRFQLNIIAKRVLGLPD